MAGIKGIYRTRMVSGCTKALLAMGALGMLTACEPAVPVPAEGPGSADTYSIAAGVPFRRAAPGVLANDRGAGEGATAQLVKGPKFGSVTLETDGSFVYESKYKYAGRDLFTYQIVQGETISEPIPVQIGAPNVVVILVDDLGLGDVTALNPDAAIATPNIDALASAGMAFSQAHSPAAVCAPSRYSVLTGNYPYRGRLSSGIWSTLEYNNMILPGQATLGDLFAEAGYRTGFVGKMHLGGAFWNRQGTAYTRDPTRIDFTRSFDNGPTQFGFDYSFVLPAGLSGPPYAYFENDRLVRFDASSGSYEHPDSNDAAVSHFLDIDSSWGRSYGSGLIGGLIGARGWALDNYDSRNVGRILTRKAIAFLDQAITENTSAEYPQPFFLYFTPPQLHTPYSPPQYFDLTFADDSAQATEGTAIAGSGAIPRLDMLRELDLMVGAVVDFLEERGQLDNTLIIFSSDNGPTVWENQKADVYPYPQGTEGDIPLRGSKGEIYEGGHRVPLLVRWGNGSPAESMIAPGARSAELLGLNDVAATLYSLLGKQRPLNQANDSKSFLPVLLDNDSDGLPVRDHLIVQGSPGSAAKNLPYVDRAFYKRDVAGDLWKLTVVSSSSDPLAELVWGEFYNLSADPGESTNLFADAGSQELLQAMQAEYAELIARPQTVANFK